MLTVHEALDFYWKEHASQKTSAATIENCISRLKGYFNAATPIGAVGIPESRQYVRMRKAKASTAGKELTVLRSAARHNFKWRRLQPHEMPVIEIPTVATSKAVWFFQDELAAIRRCAPDQRTLDYIDLSYYTAARRNAVETLRKVNIDWPRKNIIWNPEFETNKRRPPIKIDPEIVPTIERLLRGESEFLLGSDAEMIVPFQKTCSLAGLLNLKEREGRPTAKATPHMLRHSRATHLLWAGTWPYEVAALLGDTVETVLRVYGHRSPEYMKNTFKNSIRIGDLS